MKLILGTCKEAIAIAGRGLVLDFRIYCQKGLKDGERASVKIIQIDGSVIETTVELAMVLSGKRLRYDMDPTGIIITDPKITTDQIVGSLLILECDYDLWHPDN